MPGNRHAATRSCQRREPERCGRCKGNGVVEERERAGTATHAEIDDRSRSGVRKDRFVEVRRHGMAGNVARPMISIASPDRSTAGLRWMPPAASTRGPN